MGGGMGDDQHELAERIVHRAGRLVALYGRTDPDAPTVSPAQKVAKRSDWLGFKVKLQSPEAADRGFGFVRIRLLGELMFYARLDRGWQENPDRISDIRSKAGDWSDRFLRLR